LKGLNILIGGTVGAILAILCAMAWAIATGLYSWASIDIVLLAVNVILLVQQLRLRREMDRTSRR
jgi:hypothetical protein